MKTTSGDEQGLVTGPPIPAPVDVTPLKTGVGKDSDSDDN